MAGVAPVADAGATRQLSSGARDGTRLDAIIQQVERELPEFGPH
jgi:hypothetical protein